MASKAKLWAAQESEYPGSEELTIAQVLDWADAHPERAMRVALALQYKTVIWYIIPGATEFTTYRGYRFGTRGPEYASL